MKRISHKLVVAFCSLLLASICFAVSNSSQNAMTSQDSATAQHKAKSHHHHRYHHKGRQCKDKKHLSRCPHKKNCHKHHGKRHCHKHHHSSNQLNINNADAQSLRQTTGLSWSQAKAAINYRQQHGRFNSVDDLAQVRNIGPKYVAKHRQQLEQALDFS